MAQTHPSARNCVKLIEDVRDFKSEDQEHRFRGLNSRRVWSTPPGSGRRPKPCRSVPLTANASCATCLDWTTPRTRRPRLWRADESWGENAGSDLVSQLFQCLQIPWCGTFWKPTSPNASKHKVPTVSDRGQNRTPEPQRRLCQIHRGCKWPTFWDPCSSRSVRNLKTSS